MLLGATGAGILGTQQSNARGWIRNQTAINAVLRATTEKNAIEKRTAYCALGTVTRAGEMVALPFEPRWRGRVDSWPYSLHGR